MGLKELMPEDWREALAEEFDKPYFQQLEAFVEEERNTQTIYPPPEDVFSAFAYTPYSDLTVLLFGQDPYHGPGQAHGLSFSVKPGIKTPPSLRNMYKELKTDLGCEIPNNGYLEPWAKQGVMMLNAVLTVRHKQANSHQRKGWEKFTDAVIKKVNEKDDRVVFVLWGGKAKKKAKFVDTDKHVIVSSGHPSPLSAHNGFFGSQPYSKVNAALTEAGKDAIDWQIPNI